MTVLNRQGLFLQVSAMGSRGGRWTAPFVEVMLEPCPDPQEEPVQEGLGQEGPEAGFHLACGVGMS